MNTDRSFEDKLMWEQVESWRTRINLLRRVRTIVQDFDGKVYNCRFEDAVREYDWDNGVSTYAYKGHYDSSKKFIHVENRRSVKQGDYRWTDIEDRYTEVRVVLTAPEDGKRPRIDAAGTTENIDKAIENLESEIADTYESHHRIDEALSYFEQAKALIQKANEIGNYTFKKVYGLGWNVARSHY